MRCRMIRRERNNKISKEEILDAHYHRIIIRIIQGNSYKLNFLLFLTKVYEMKFRRLKLCIINFYILCLVIALNEVTH